MTVHSRSNRICIHENKMLEKLIGIQLAIFFTNNTTQQSHDKPVLWRSCRVILKGQGLKSTVSNITSNHATPLFVPQYNIYYALEVTLTTSKALFESENKTESKGGK